MRPLVEVLTLSRSKKKVYGTILSLAVLGFVVDQLILDEPRSATAGPADAEQLGVSPAGGPDQPVTRHDMPRQFPENLPDTEWSGSNRNPFTPPPEVLVRRAQRVGGGTEHPPHRTGRRPGEPPSVEEFVTSHRLSGVFVGQSAIVDGRVVLVDSKFDGAVLLRVEGGKAHFQCSDGQAILTLDRRD